MRRKRCIMRMRRFFGGCYGCFLLNSASKCSHASLSPTGWLKILPGRSNIAQCYVALDYGMFGDKARIRAALSKYLQEIRNAARAEGQERIYTHGEKAAEAEACVRREGVAVNEKTYDEMRMIGEYTHAEAYLPACMA